MKKTANFGLKKPEENDFYNVTDQNDNMDVIDRVLQEYKDGTQTVGNAENLGGKPAEEYLTGEHKHSVSDIEDFPSTMPPSSHKHSKSDISDFPTSMTPSAHTHSASEVGLGNVPNVTTNNQTPTFTVATANAELTSGEKLSVAFGKIAKAIKSLIAHLADTTSHVTSTERSTWNGKANASHGNHVPTTQTASNKVFLRNDNTWQTVTPANIGASPTGHKHTKSEITDFPTTMTPAAHNQSASTITAGTFNGKVVGNATAVAVLGDKQFRNIYAGTGELTSGTSALPTGDIYIQYE